MLKIYNNKTKEILELDFEEYLKGVVAFEMPALFEIQALKSQAVVARTYALQKIKVWAKNPPKEHPEAPLCTSSEHCQGWYSEKELKEAWGTNYDKYMDRINQAVAETRSQLIYYQDKLIDAVFHSTCGGRTEDAKNVWGGDLPYLKSMECDYCKHSPHYRSEQEVPFSKLTQKLGLPTIELLNIATNNTHRVETVNVNGKAFSGKDFRSLLALKSTWFNPLIKNITFETRGFGHGVGMCQYGADGQAKQGKDYKDIVRYYYRGVTVKNALTEDVELLNKYAGISSGQLNEILDIRFSIFNDPKDNKSKSRFVLDLAEPAEHSEVKTLTEPLRLYVDINQAKFAKVDQKVEVADGLVKAVRIGQFNSTTVRVVLDLVKEAPFEVFTLGENDEVNPPKYNRLVIDLIREVQSTPTPKPTTAPTTTPKPTAAPTTQPKVLAGKHIVVDAGHGGSDPGAVGVNGLQEKSVTLPIAKRIQELLVGAGAKVTMTRTTDTYLSLTERVRIADRTDADIYVSIHINSATSSSAHGLETYHYPGSSKGRKLASAIESELVKALGWTDRGVKTAYFYVLKYTDMVAALAEIGFIVNPSEGKALATSATREKAAKAIFNGIVAYFR